MDSTFLEASHENCNAAGPTNLIELVILISHSRHAFLHYLILYWFIINQAWGSVVTFSYVVVFGWFGLRRRGGRTLSVPATTAHIAGSLFN